MVIPYRVEEIALSGPIYAYCPFRVSPALDPRSGEPEGPAL